MSQSGSFNTGGSGGGVTSITAGPNITVSAPTGDVTIGLVNDVVTNSYQTSNAAANLLIEDNTITASGTDVSVNINFVTQGEGALVFDGIDTGYTGSSYVTAQNGIQTTNATPTSIISQPLNAGEMITIKALINGFQSTFANALGSEVLFTVYYPTAGDATIVGLPVINTNTTSTSSVTATVDTATDTAHINVVGVAAQTWNWVTTYSYMYTLTNA